MKSNLLLAAIAIILTGCEVTTPTPATQGTATSIAAPTSRPTTAGAAAPTASATASSGGNAAAFPVARHYRWAAVATGLIEPTDIQFPDDGSGRMFVLQQPGQIRIVKNGQVLPTPFIDISSKVGSRGSEQGLLGMSFHLDFQHNPYFYLNYTDTDGNTVIARYPASGDTADPSSEKVLLHIDQPFPNHNGGAVVFGPDGYLYLGLGDGGSEGDPLGNGQNTGVLLGKLLRIDVASREPYSIPPGNPFAAGGGKPEIWAYGLRNPWRLSFDHATGDLYIGDVGQDSWEEIDFLPAGSSGGANFGWSYREGRHPYSLASPPAGAQLVDPVAEYSHAEGACAVTGGYVYRGAMREWQGIYLYGDYCSGMIWGLLHPSNADPGTAWPSALLFRTPSHITSFGQDPLGEVYYADRGGTIFKLEK